MEAICPSCGETFSATEGPESPDLRCPRCGSGFTADEVTSIVTSPASATADLEAGPRVPAPPADLPEIPGYRVLGFIARGGMGMLLKAHHAALDRPVAIKIPLPQYLGGPRDQQRFLREARASARLRHPNICPIYAVEEHAGRPYIAMGFIEGENLRAFAKRRRPTPHHAAQIVAILARAVGYAHAHGVIHRDIKPSNVMIDAETREPVLTDFGLAKELSRENVQVTRVGQLVGTPAYMAPEQAAGRAADIGPLTDVYSLGAVLYELLCGRPPFLGTVGEILSRVQSEEVQPPRRIVPHLHRDLETICLKALSKDPAARYTSAGALAEDLERFCAGETILARRTGLAARACRKIRRRPLTAVAIAVGAVAVAAAALIAVRASHTYKVAAMVRTFETDLDTKDWTVQRLQEAETTVAALGQLDAEQGRAARERLYARFAEAIRESFAKRLSPAEVAAIEKALDALAARSPGVVPDLRKAFKDRLRRWVPLADLAAPFAALESAFDRAVVQADASGLRPAQAGDAKRSPLVLTRLAGEGNTQLEVEFAPDWESARELGLWLGTSRDKGYAFILGVGWPALAGEDRGGTPPESLAAARAARGPVVLKIIKDGAPLWEDVVLPDRLAAGPLRLTAGREEGHVTCQINDLPPVSVYDAFSMTSGPGGVLGLQWPSGVHVTHLRARRQEIPLVASPLERGDQLFSQGKFIDALDFYQRQAIVCSGEVLQEVRYKEGLCLLRLKRDAEAAALFEPLRLEAGDTWPVMAACNLWALRLQQNRFEEVDAICDGLVIRQYRFERLAALAPEEIRRRIFDFYWSLSRGINFLRPDPKRAEKLSRLIAFNRLLGVSDFRDFWPKFSLLRAYRMEGLSARALELGAELVNSPAMTAYSRHEAVIEDYAWMLCENKQHDKALAMVEHFLLDAQGNLVPRYYQLLAERARVRALMGQWGPAEKDLDDFFRLVPRDVSDYRTFSRACLIKGFMRRRQGDEAGALEAWRRGGRPASKPAPEAGSPELASGLCILQGQILAAFTDQITEADVDILLSQLVGAMRGLLPGLPALDTPEKGETLTKQVARGLLPVGAATLRDAWLRPRGMKCAEQIALLDLSFADLVRLPAVLVVSEAVRQMVFPDGASADEEQLVWDAMGGASLAYFRGKLAETELLGILYTLKGQTNLTGWAGVAPRLEPAIRGPAAYLFGRLYLKRKAAKDAQDFFKTAVADAPAGSALKRLAQAELDRLGGQ